jgi:signal transduction histidine kinase
MSMYDMVDTTPEGYSEGEELSKMFSEDDMSEAFEERDIDVITEEINFYKQQAGMAILEIGKRLVEAKAQLSHGEWLPWLEKKVEFSERSAQQYIRLWKEYGKSATVADLGVRKALVLLALPDTERDSFAGEKHEVNGEEKTAAEMTVKELEKAVAERNTAREEAEQAKADLYAAREATREARDHVEALRGELEALKNRPTEVAIEQRDATEEQLAAARQEAEDAAARRVLDRLTDAAQGKGVTLTLTGGGAVVRSVPRIVEEILYNLCDNAVVYNHPGGSVTVTVENGSDGARVSVTDTGVGIPREAQSRVFERFYRVDKSHSGGGTGLGLSIVKHGAAYLGARVDLESREGRGSTFTVTFPPERDGTCVPDDSVVS